VGKELKVPKVTRVILELRVLKVDKVLKDLLVHKVLWGLKVL
jgi:hypothetical protein